MIGWTPAANARHIPEDELHAYLDQALSRSQCVEIECHLAECYGCALERDRVAALRDRTTALLADTAPRRVILAPPFEQLAERGRKAAAHRRVVLLRAARRGGIAASVAGAMLAGWLARGIIVTESEPQVVATVTPSVTEALAPVPPAATPEERTLEAVGPVQTVTEAGTQAGGAPPSAAGLAMEPRRVDVAPRVELAGTGDDPVVVTPVAVQVMTLSAADDELVAPLDGLWQSVDWQEAQRLTGGNVPRVDGLPIMDIQVQQASAEERPIVVVSQQHPAGGVIRTIEGPVERVAALVEKGVGRRLNASAASFTPPDYVPDDAGGTRRGLRVLTVTGTFPSDSLNALARLIDLRD